MFTSICCIQYVFMMSALFNRRIYVPFGLLRDGLVAARDCATVRKLNNVYRRCHMSVCHPSYVLSHERARWLNYFKTCRHLSDDGHTNGARIETAAVGRWSNRCNCCGLNSKGAQDLATFLSDEVKLEKKSAWNQLPKLHGFHLSSSTGPTVVLTRKYHNEIVRIRFNVTNSLFEDVFAQYENTEGGLEDTDDDVSPHLVSKPAFDVEIDRGADCLLVIRCVIDPPTDLPLSFISGHDTFSIDGVAVVSKLHERWSDRTYCMSKASISTRLQKHLLSLLARRGIGSTFAHELIELSTAYEHLCYVKFLEQLHDFMAAVPAVT